MTGVTQVILAVPEALQPGVDAGLLAIYGGAVRHVDTGRIAGLLEEVAEPAAKGLVEKLGQVAREAQALPAPVKVAGFVAAGTTAAVAAAWVAKRRGDRKELEAAQAQTLEAFNGSLRKYLEAAQAGTMSTGIIDALLADLQQVSPLAGDAADDEALGQTAQLIRRYTEQLQAANPHVDFAGTPADVHPLEQIEHDLRAQRRLFQRAIEG